MMNISRFTFSEGVHGDAASATPPLLQLYFYARLEKKSSNVETFVAFENLLYWNLKRISDNTAFWT